MNDAQTKRDERLLYRTGMGGQAADHGIGHRAIGPENRGAELRPRWQIEKCFYRGRGHCHAVSGTEPIFIILASRFSLFARCPAQAITGGAGGGANARKPNAEQGHIAQKMLDE
jgi:hypothetical protein